MFLPLSLKLLRSAFCAGVSLNIHSFIHSFIFKAIESILRKGMFYLMMHSTHFIYGYMASAICKQFMDSQKCSYKFKILYLFLSLSLKQLSHQSI